MYGDYNKVVIDNCVSDINIISTRTGEDRVYAGGRIGYSPDQYSRCMVTNSAYVGRMSSENISITDAGALIGCVEPVANFGYDYNDVENCYVDAEFGENVTGQAICGDTL